MSDNIINSSTNGQKKLTDPLEMMEWTRKHWTYLKSINKLEETIEKIKKVDQDLEPYSVEDIIAFEESCPYCLK